MSFSNTYEEDILDYIFGGVSLTPPSTFYVALLTAAPNEDGTGFSEVTTPGSNGYARAAISRAVGAAGWYAAVQESSVTKLKNQVALTYGPATTNWSAATHFAIMSASSGGTMIAWAALSASVTVTTGNYAKFEANSLVIQLD